MKQIIKLLFPLLCLFPGALLANPTAHLKRGDQTAEAFLKKVEAKKKEGGSYPFYSGISPEAHLKETDLKGRAQQLSRTDPASQMVSQSAESRSPMKIDLQHDPLLTGSQRVMDNPLEVIGGKGTHVVEVKSGGRNEILVCEEAGDDSHEICTQELNVRVVKTKSRKAWNGQFHFSKERKAEEQGHYLGCGALRQGVLSANSGNITEAYKACLPTLKNRRGRGFVGGYVRLPLMPFNLSQIIEVTINERPPIKGRNGQTIRRRYDTRCSTDINKRGESQYDCHPLIKIVYEEDSYEILPDEWSAHCNRLEERADQGLCSYVSKVCTQGKQTRVIDGISVTRDCWQYTLTYGCSYPSKNDCGPLRARGCAQIHSDCKQRVGNVCVVYNQTYECKGAPQTTHAITGGNTPFCLDGNCRDQSYEANNEMMSSLAQLALLKELQGQFGTGGFFKGTDNRCSKQPLSFKDCCGSNKGWGNDLGLSSCSSMEKLLNQKRKAGLCHYVGTYCAKKVLGKCIKKKSSYCCFGSKLLKAFHEQGRPQIGMGWGRGKEPLCRGFTIAEIQRIDFSKLDLREVFEDLMKDFKPGKMQGIGHQVGERLETIKQGLRPPTQKQPAQRPEA